MRPPGPRPAILGAPPAIPAGNDHPYEAGAHAALIWLSNNGAIPLRSSFRTTLTT